MSDLEIKAGATLRFTVQWRELDGVTLVPLAGLEARMQFRKKASDAVPLLSLTSTNNGGLTMVPASSDIQGYVSASDTAGLPTLREDRPGVWDLEVYDPLDAEEVERLGPGTFTVVAEVVR